MKKIIFVVIAISIIIVASISGIAGNYAEDDEKVISGDDVSIEPEASIPTEESKQGRDLTVEFTENIGLAGN